MTTPRQIQAHRSNARRSKGPRSPRGKGRSRLNAVTHGLSAQTLILPGEDEYYPGDEDPHEPDPSPKRQRVDSRGHQRFTRWRVGLVCDLLARRDHISAAWRVDLAPANPYEEDLVRQAVSLSWRLDRADRVQAAPRADRIADGPAEAGPRNGRTDLAAPRSMH